MTPLTNRTENSAEENCTFTSQGISSTQFAKPVDVLYPGKCK